MRRDVGNWETEGGGGQGAGGKSRSCLSVLA